MAIVHLAFYTLSQYYIKMYAQTYGFHLESSVADTSYNCPQFDITLHEDMWTITHRCRVLKHIQCWRMQPISLFGVCICNHKDVP